MDPRLNKPSASAMARLAICPASHKMSKLVPEATETSACSLGTELHKHMENGTFSEDPKLNETLEWLRSEEFSIIQSLFPEVAETETLRELRFWAKDESYSGQPDRVVMDKKKTMALIIDYKFGYHPVAPSEENLQLASLAVLLKQAFPSLQTISGVILQPFVSRSYSICQFDEDSLEKADAFIASVVAQANEENAKCRPSEEGCRYCPAYATCPAVNYSVTMFPSLAELSQLNWADWTAEKKRQAYDLANLAKKWATQIEALVRKDLENNIPLPYLELGKGRKLTKITDASEAFARLHSEFPEHVTPQAFANCCSVSLTSLTKLVHQALSAGGVKVTEKKAKETLQTAIADIVEVSYSAPPIKVSGANNSMEG